MGTKLVPDGDVVSGFYGNYAAVPGPSFFAALDADSASYVQMIGNSRLRFTITDSGLGATDYASIQLHFAGAVAPAGFSPAPTFAQVIIGSGVAFGSVMASSQLTPTGPSFIDGTIQVGAVLSQAELDAAMVEIITFGATSQDALVNDLYVEIVDTFRAPVATVLGPSGVLTTPTPTIQWSSSVDDASREEVVAFRIRVFNAAQYSVGGFNPATSAALVDTGPRPVAGTNNAFTLPPLPPDSYQAWVSVIQKDTSNVPDGNGGPIVRSDHASVYASTSFAVIAAYPTITGPTIKVDAVRDLTDTQKRRLFEPHRPVSRMTLFTWDGQEITDLDIVKGSVSFDSGSAVRSKLSATVADLGLVPTSRAGALDAATPLHPFGSYVHVVRGFNVDRYGNVLVGLGVFRLDSVAPTADTGQVDIKGSDFAGYLIDARFGYPVTRQTWSTVPPTPLTVLATAQQIITEAGLAYRTPTVSATQVAQNYVNKLADDRSRSLDDLAASIDGWNWYADTDGVLYFGAGPDYVNDATAYTLFDGTHYRIVTSRSSLDRSAVYDTAIAYDQQATVIGGAYDAAHDSPIHRSSANPADLFVGAGPFAPGGKPFFYSSPVITSLAGAQAAARSRLGAAALPAESIDISGVPLPDLRPGKIVACPRPGTSALLRWLTTKVTMPLEEGTMMSATAIVPTTDVVATS